MISLYVFTSRFKVKGRSALGRNLWKCRFVTGSLTFVSLQWGKICLSGIYIAYMGSSQAISNSIAPQPRFFSSSVESLGRHAVPSGFDLGQKKPRFRGYTVGYSPRRPHIYITYIYVYIINPSQKIMSMNNLVYLKGILRRQTSTGSIWALLSPKSKRESTPDGVDLTAFPFYMWLVNWNLGIQNTLYIFAFSEISKAFIREGSSSRFWDTKEKRPTFLWWPENGNLEKRYI